MYKKLPIKCPKLIEIFLKINQFKKKRLRFLRLPIKNRFNR